MTQQPDPALYERMEKLVRAMGSNSSFGKPFGENGPITPSSMHYTEARSIVAELPAPTDPDLLLAREVAATDRSTTAHMAAEIRRGDTDEWPLIRVTLAAIKRTRQEMEGKA